MDQNKHFFISYKSLELDFAIRLATDLKNAGFCIWMDTQERNISTSDDWRLAIETAITPQNCTALVAVLSPAYISSTYCRNELARADRLGIPIIPVFIHAIDEEDWPLEIERLQHISFIGNINGEGYDSQLIKLIDLLKDNYPEHLIAIPDKETQYINSLIGSLESQFGVSNFIEPRMYIEVYEFRPKPTVDDEWGYSLLIPDINSDSIVESTPIQSIDEAIRKTNKFVLLGEPGAGKTTTLRRIALNAAKLHLSDPQHTPIPLLLNLPQWARNQTFEEFIVQKWTLSENPIELIDSGRLCLFLDGLNEMGEEGPKRGNEISGWIANRSADSIIVLTCRIADFSNGLKIDNIPTVEIHELNDEQIKAFVSKYLEDNDIEYFQNQIFPDDAEDAPTPSPYALVHLARNPYLLTALLFIYLSSENKILPQNTGALFQQLVRSLWRREELRGTISLDFKNIEASLSRLAFSMIDSGMPVDVSEGYALFYVVDTEIIRHGINSNLLIQDDGSIRFYHQLVQEYFAALGLSQVGLDHIKLLDSNQSYKDSPFSFIFQLEHVETNKWDQVIIALCGIETEPERIIKIVAIIDPGLGIRCINSGVKINLADVYDSFFRAANIDDEKIRSAGITALGKLGDSRAIPFLVTNIFNPDEYVQKISISAIANFREQAIPKLIDALKTQPSKNHNPIIQALANIGKPSIEPLLIELSSSPNEDVIASSCTILGQIGDISVASEIAKLLDSDNNKIVLASIKALADLEYIPAASKLIEIYHGKPSYQQLIIAIAEALGKIKDDKNIPILIKLAKKLSWEIHIAAFESLKEYVPGSELATNFVQLFSGLSSRSREKREECIQEIARSLGVQGLLHSINHKPNIFWPATNKLIEISNESDFDTLLSYRDTVEKKLFHLRVYAVFAQVIGSWGNQKYCEYLIDQLDHPYNFVIGETIKAISKLRCKTAVPHLIPILDDYREIYSNSRQRICDAAAIALIDIGVEEGKLAAKDWAMQEINSRIKQDQIAPIKVLGVVGDQISIPRLIEISRYRNRSIRSAAINALKSIKESGKARNSNNT